jgi:hypothetical protein
MFDVCRFFWIISLMSFIIIPCVWIPAYVRGQAAPGSPSSLHMITVPVVVAVLLNSLLGDHCAPRSTSELPATSLGSNMTDPRFSLNANMTGARSPSEFSTNRQGLSISNTSSGQQARACSSLAKPSSIVIDTDKTTYLPGQVALIDLRVFDDNGCNVNTTVTVEAIT